MKLMNLQLFGGGGGKSHVAGARGNAGPRQPQSASDTSDLVELTQYMQDKWAVQIKGVENVPFEIVRRTAQGYEDLNKEYNHEIVLTEINGSENRTGTYASASRYSKFIQFNPSVFSSVESVRDSYENDVKSGWHPVGTTYENIMDHEIGHVLAGRLYDKKYNTGTLEYMNAMRNRTLEKAIVSEACKNAKKVGRKEGVSSSILKNDISMAST